MRIRPAPADTPTAAAEAQVGRFRRLHTIGSGGFATVYLAEDLELGRQVALKLLHPHLTTDEDFIRRFREEARAAARLRHRNIVRIFDAAQTDDGRPYLVMELLEGTLLSKVITERAPLALSETLSILTQLASALDYLHGHGLIHRDLKPSNVMIDASGVATLMDFGIARSVLEQSHLTVPGQAFGTATYMAPEQAAGGTPGPAADIYSLGIVTYEMVSGRPPFRGNTQRLLYSHLYEQPPPLDNVAAPVAAALQRALEKDPTQRYLTAGDFAGEMASAASGAQTLAAPAEATAALQPDAAPLTTEALPSEERTDPTIAARSDTATRLPSPQPPPTDAATIIPPPPAAPPLGSPTAGQAAPDKRLLLAGAGAVLAIALAALLVIRARPTGTQKAAPNAVATAAAQAVGAAPAPPPGNMSIRVTSPADGANVNSSVTIRAEQSGATIKPATENDPNAAHYHYFIDRDPASILKPGQPIPSGQPDIIHSADATFTAADLRLGQHDVWLVLAHTDHSPFSPNVQAKVTFTVVPAAEAVQTFAGTGSKGFTDGAGSSAQFSTPTGVAVDASGNVYVVDAGNSRVRKITAGGIVSTIAGAGQFDGPRGIAVDKSGNVYVADTGNNRIRKITPDGTVTTLAGSDSPGVGGGGLADGLGSAAQFRLPVGVAVDGAGNLYVADTGNNRIRKITPEGRVSTVAGSGAAGSGGFADGPAESARFNAPRGIAVDSAGNVYVADTLNQRIRKVSSAGAVTTIAGSGDQGIANGLVAAARFSNPDGIAVDGSGNLYVSDNSSFRIREILTTGVVIDVAGTREGFADGSPASAQFDFPAGVAADGSGNIYVADSNNNRIRKITPFKQGR